MTTRSSHSRMPLVNMLPKCLEREYRIARCTYIFCPSTNSVKSLRENEKEGGREGGQRERVRETAREIARERASALARARERENARESARMSQSEPNRDRQPEGGTLADFSLFRSQVSRTQRVHQNMSKVVT